MKHGDEIGTLWETVQESETQRTLPPVDEETCKSTHDPRKTRQIKHFLRSRPDDISHHNETKMWYLKDFKRTSDVRPDHLEEKDSMSSKQYQNFMDILRKAKEPGWTSEQINVTVGSKTINENVMDTNLDKIGINQKNKRKSKS
jgi:hypothetical protein